MPNGKMLMGKTPKPGPVKPAPKGTKVISRKIEDTKQLGFGAMPGGKTPKPKGGGIGKPKNPAYPIGKRRMSGAEAASRADKINKVVGMYNAKIGKPGGPSAGKPGRVPGKDPIAGAFVGVDKKSPWVQGIGMARSIYDGVTGQKLNPQALLNKKTKPVMPRRGGK